MTLIPALYLGDVLLQREQMEVFLVQRIISSVEGVAVVVHITSQFNVSAKFFVFLGRI